jgi:hypothetical protein
VGVIINILLYTPFFQEYEVYKGIFGDAINHFEMIRSILTMAQPVLVFLSFFLLQTGVLFLLISPKQTKKGQEIIKVVVKTIILLLVITITLSHWFILALQANIFTRIPGWYWEVTPKPFSSRDFYFLILLFLVISSTIYIQRKPKKHTLSLILLVMLGWLLQIGFGFIEGQGVESLRLKYAGSWHKSHAMNASVNNVDLINTIRQYETLHGQYLFQKTKPPGTLSIYIVLRYFTDWLIPQSDLEGRFFVLTTFIAYVFPLLAMLVIPLLVRLGKMFEEASINSYGLIYILMPNVILIPLFLDQALYPLLFIIGAYLGIETGKRQSFLLAVLDGALLYFLSFLSFSMLPLLPFTFFYLGIVFLFNRNKQTFLQTLKIMAGILIGIILLFTLFSLCLNYNAITRYQNAMDKVRTVDFLEKVGAPPSESINNTSSFLSLDKITSALFINNLEYATAVGFPIFFLFIAQSILVIKNSIVQKPTARDIILLTFFLTYIAMNIFAPIRGEVARLWLFWAPMFSLFAATAIDSFFIQKERVYIVLNILQLFTIYLTYKFQDLAP